MAMLLAAALMMQGAAAPPRVEVGMANWAAFRPIEPAVSLPTDGMMDAVEAILASGRCRMVGQSPRRFDIGVRYAIRYDAHFNPERVMVEDLRCRPLEELVGRIVTMMLRERHFAVPSGPANSWYTNRIHFTLES
jgi:hypothetical protein